MSSDTAKRRRHKRTHVATVAREPHIPRSFHVIDCACGWQSPLCATAERAAELYSAHRRSGRANAG